MGEPDIEKMKAEKDVEGLIKALKYSLDMEIRGEAALALGEIGDARAVGPLTQALKDKNDFFVADVEEALVKIGEPAVEPLIQALKDEDSGVRWAAAATLGEIKDERAVAPLIQALKDGGRGVRWQAAMALVEMGEPAVEPLIQALKDEEEEVRWAATEALGRMGDARAVESLIQALKDEDELVRKTAKEALEKIKAKKS